MRYYTNLKEYFNRLPLSPRSRKILKWSLIFLLAYSITGFLILPPVLKYVITKNLSEKLNRPVAIRKIRVNPFVLSADVKGFEITQRKGGKPFFAFRELYVNLQTASIFRRGIVLSEFMIDRPYIKLIRNEDMTYNFSDLIKPAEKNPDRNRNRSDFR